MHPACNAQTWRRVVPGRDAASRREIGRDGDGDKRGGKGPARLGGDCERRDVMQIVSEPGQQVCSERTMSKHGP